MDDTNKENNETDYTTTECNKTHCELVNLDGFLQVFPLLVCLKVINFSHNYLTSIFHGIFFNLPNLESIDLSYNRIESIQKHAFDNLPKLKTLNLA